MLPGDWTKGNQGHFKRIHNLAVAKFAAQTTGLKPALESVLFANNKTVASDAVQLIEISTVEWANEVDYPSVVSDGKLVNKLDKGVLLNAEKVGSLKLVKEHTHLEVLNNVALFKNKDRYELVSTNLEERNVLQAKAVDGNFPDYDKIFSDGSDVIAEININGVLLAELCKTLAGIGTLGNIVTLKIRKDGKPLEIHARSVETTQVGRALIMPMRG